MNKPLIHHSRPTIGKEEIEAVSGVISSGHIAQGREVEAFEAEFADKIGVKYAAAVSSGTTALHLALLSLGVSAGDEVIIPSYVCTALLNAVNYTGATPVIADIDQGTLNINPADVEKRVTSRTKAIVVPYMFGRIADIEALQKTGVPLIEDCAQAVGAKVGRKMAGSSGAAGIFSFYATKMMTCGEGGMIVSDSKEVIEQVKHSREYDNRDRYEIRFNYKMTDMQAALGRKQLEALDDFIARRKEIAGLYNDAFQNLALKLPDQHPQHVYYRYILMVENVASWIKHLAGEGIACAKPVFKPLHHYLNADDCPHADQVYQQALSIPIYPTLSNSDIEKIIRALVETHDRLKPEMSD